jgi:hypothetical protein
MTCWKLAKRSFLLGVSFALSLGPVERLSGSAGMVEPANPNQGPQTARILSVRKVLRNQYFASRYPQIHYYTLYISLRASEQTYCTEYETPVLDEIADVSSATNQDIDVIVKGKSINIQTPGGRRLKAYLTKGSQC